MTRKVKQGLLFGSALLISGVASAHPLILHGQGFVAGFIHPLTGLDHLLALFAAGLLASRYQRRHAGLMLSTMLIMMAAGATLGLYGPSMPVIELGMSGSLIFLGGVIVLGKHLSIRISLMALVMIGVFHGYAHGQEMAASFNTLLFFTGFLFSSLVLQLVGLFAGQWQYRYNIVYRLGGGVIVLSGLGLVGSSL